MHDHAKRRSRLRTLVKKAGAAAILVTNQVNVRYLTGFTGSSGWLLLTKDEEILISDFRYITQIAEECGDLKVEIRTNSAPIHSAAAKVVKACGVSDLCIEGDSLTIDAHRQLAEGMEGVTMHPTSGWTAGLRAIKDSYEVSLIRRAIEMAQRTFTAVKSSLRADQTERLVAADIDRQIRLLGGEGVSFDPIVGVGPQAALPHANPGETRIGDFPFVLIDWGAVADGYRSDLTRVLATGKIPPKLERIYKVVLEAQQAAIAAIKPGAVTKDVDNAARSVITSARHGKHFGHGLGHGLGLQIHETPFMGRTSEDVLQPGMVVTVEPGIYIPGFGGVRIEDDILVTKKGHEVLSSLPKSFEDCVAPLL